jgi:hypothetical protein
MLPVKLGVFHLNERFKLFVDVEGITALALY